MNPKSKNKQVEAPAHTRAARQMRDGDAAVAAKRPHHTARLFAVNVKSADVNPALPVAPRRPHRSWRMWLLALLAGTGTLLWVARGQPQDAPDPNAGPMPVEDPAQTTAPIEMQDTSDTNQSEPEIVLVVTNAMGQTEMQTNAPGRRPRHSFRRRSSSSSTGGTGDYNFAGDNAANGRAAYSTFSIITQRNIFDPNRTPGRQPIRFSPTAHRTIESFALRGTASLGANTFAVFDGTSSEYHKDAKVTDTIADYKITSITPEAVKLAAGTNAIELRVGMQMRREPGGPWSPSAASESFAATPSAVPGTTIGSGPATVDSSPGGPESEVLKRLMKQREQE